MKTWNFKSLKIRCRVTVTLVFNKLIIIANVEHSPFYENSSIFLSFFLRFGRLFVLLRYFLESFQDFISTTHYADSSSVSANSGCSQQSCTCLRVSQNYSRYHVRCNHATQLPTKRFRSFCFSRAPSPAREKIARTATLRNKVLSFFICPPHSLLFL